MICSVIRNNRNISEYGHFSRCVFAYLFFELLQATINVKSTTNSSSPTSKLANDEIKPTIIQNRIANLAGDYEQTF